MAYEVTLETFSGPLDLLLHLIQKHEVNIHDISIALITEQYLEYLRAMEELSLEIASEFIVMAATLLAIKSRTLLPRQPKTDPETGEEELDPREQLIQQLLEYQRCKWGAEQLKERELLQSLVFTRNPMDLHSYAPSEPPRVTGVSMWDLVDAFRKILVRVPAEERVAEIKGQVTSVEDQMDKVLDVLRKVKRSSFFTLTAALRTRSAMVSTFLALLELIKLGSIACTQVLAFGDIEISLTEVENG